MERICKNCGFIDASELNDCPVCKKNDWEDLYLYQIKDVSTDESFVNAMVKLRNENPVEYQLKMQQFEMQKKQEKQLKNIERERNKLRCPYCNSANVKKISGTERVASIALFGIFSKKINKSFKCNDCGGTF